MATADDLLIRALIEDSQNDYTDNSTYKMGRSLSGYQFPLQNQMSPWEMLLSGALSGFGGGVLQGMGEQQAQEEQAKRSEALKQISEAKGEEKYSLVDADPALRKYGALMRLADAMDQREAAQELEKLKLQKSFDRQIVELGDGHGGMNKYSVNPLTGEKTALGDSYPQFKPDAAGDLSKDRFAGEDSMRKEISGKQEVQDFSELGKQLTAIKKSINDKSAVADLDFTFGVMKSLDPRSIVRETEQGQVIDSAGAPRALLGQINKDLNGEGALSQPTRQKLMNLVERRYDTQKETVDAIKNQYTEIARDRGYNPENAIAIPSFNIPASDAVPPGMKKQVNKITGETRIVPK